MHTKTNSRHESFIHECIDVIPFTIVIMITLLLCAVLTVSVTCALVMMLIIYCRILMLIQQIAKQIE